MSRTLLLLLALALLPGCTSFKPTAPASKELAATLVFVQGDKPLDMGSGIVSVGNYYFPSAPVKLAYIAPGERAIGYNCPGLYLCGWSTDRGSNLRRWEKLRTVVSWRQTRHSRAGSMRCLTIRSRRTR